MKLKDFIEELERIKKEYGDEIEIKIADRYSYDLDEPRFEVDNSSEGIIVEL